MSKPNDMTTTEALDILDNIITNAEDAEIDPEHIQAMTLAWNALKDVAEQEGCR